MLMAALENGRTQDGTDFVEILPRGQRRTGAVVERPDRRQVQVGDDRPEFRGAECRQILRAEVPLRERAHRFTNGRDGRGRNRPRAAP